MKEKALYITIGVVIGVVLAPKIRQLPFLSKLPSA